MNHTGDIPVLSDRVSPIHPFPIGNDQRGGRSPPVWDRVMGKLTASSLPDWRLHKLYRDVIGT